MLKHAGGDSYCITLPSSALTHCQTQTVSYHILSLDHICFVLSALLGNLSGQCVCPSVCSGVCFSGRLKSPFLSKQPCEPEPSRSPLRQASPLSAGSASPVPAAGLSSLIPLTQTDPFLSDTHTERNTSHVGDCVTYKRCLCVTYKRCLCFGPISTRCCSLSINQSKLLT